MARTFYLACISLCAAAAGCGLVAHATRNLSHETHRAANEVCMRARNRKAADAAWDQVRQSSPGVPFSRDYARGFKDGFLDYLEAGGTGEPPPVPDKRYWGVHYQTVEGHQAMEDWFAGYRHGAAAAQQSGLREVIMLPVSLPAGPAPLQGSGPVHPSLGPSPTPPSEAVLPLPRKLEVPPGGEGRSP
ncbi:MAG TPA: hypothetical protein VNK04_08170 [Gemmataceae bacterium]|nr:hypothetical protein [Gemmataceae bacterium]